MRTLPALAALSLFVLLAAGALGAAPPAGRISVAVRDSRTGLVLPARLRVERGGGASSEWELARGETREVEGAGALRLRVSAPGHAPLEASFEPSGEEALPVTFFLDPLSAAGEAEPETEPGRGRVSGTVADAAGEPLAGVYVRLEGTEACATSGQDGAFSLDFPVPRPDPEALPPLGTLVVSRPGFGELRVTGLLLTEGGHRLPLTLAAGATAREERLSHKLYAPAEELALAQSAPHPEEAPPDPSPRSAGPIPAALVVDPPDTVKVGMTCTCSTCTTVDVVSLETYVKRGLNDEWISSWSQHSLRAGSLAYRSYGSYYVLHPLNANYDICSSTCCQVNDADTSTSTDTAVGYTAGILLQRSNAVLRSEYSAEDNAWDDPNDGLSCSNTDLSCGDGYAGSPAASWPCLSDSVCATHGCYGHGRGMCQWGTQRWASNQGQLWNWIENHYYNDGGAGSGYRTAYMTSPFSLSSISPSPASLAAGSTFTMTLQATNLAELSHTQVLIGASLYSAATGYVSDAAHDTKVTLTPGANSPARPFAVPVTAPPGAYDLIAALWLDTDGDSVITGADLSLTSLTATGAVTVTAGGPPAPVKNLRWTAGSHLWSWDAVTANQNGGATTIDHYEVRRATAPAAAGSLLASPTTTSWADASAPTSGCWYYAVRAVDTAGLRDSESVVDNPAAAFAGTWTTGNTAAGRYGDDYRFASTGGTGANTATWSFTAPETGAYDVALWYPQGSNRSTAARFRVTHAAGSSLVLVNQQVNGGAWFSLGASRLVAGQSYTVTLDDAEPSGFVVLADAVRWTKVP